MRIHIVRAGVPLMNAAAVWGVAWLREQQHNQSTANLPQASTKCDRGDEEGSRMQKPFNWLTHPASSA